MLFARARVTRTQQNQYFPSGGKTHNGCFLGNSHFESTYRSYSISPLFLGNITFESMRISHAATRCLTFSVNKASFAPGNYRRLAVAGFSACVSRSHQLVAPLY